MAVRLTRRKIVTLAVAAAILPVVSVAEAEGWPTRSITWIVPFAAGGPGDAVARVLAPGLSEVLRQPIVIENVGGAGGTIALRRLANSPADGYVMASGNGGTHTFSQLLDPKPLYDAVTDFAPVSLISEGAYVLVTRESFPANTLQDFIAYAKANQTHMQFGSAGFGSGTYVACALLNKTIGADITHVPYRSTSLAMQDMIGRRIDYLCDEIITAQSLIKAKSVKALAILGRNRTPLLPNVATADEQGLSNFEVPNWNGIFLPKGAPQSIVERLSEAINKTLDLPLVRKRMSQFGVNVPSPHHRGPVYLAKFVTDEIPKWTPLLSSMRSKSGP